MYSQPIIYGVLEQKYLKKFHLKIIIFTAFENGCINHRHVRMMN